jgi:hypothetical protein
MMLGSAPSYDVFSQHSLAERIDWIDELTVEQIIDQYAPRTIKKFLSQLFERETNSYLRQRAIEYMSELTLLDIIRHDYTKDFLLEEVQPTGNSFIDSTRLKYLFLLYGDDSECYRVFEQESRQEDQELASEASYRAGLIHLLYRVNQVASSDVISELLMAKHWFDTAQQQVENRVDARFFSLASDYLVALLCLQPDVADPLYEELTRLLWQRQIWGYTPTSELLEHRIFQSLSSLRLLVRKTADEPFWTNYKKELLFLSNYVNELLISNDLPTRLLNSLNAFTTHPVSTILSQYYIHNLSACQVKIRAILADAEPSEQPLIDFLRNLLVRLEAYHEKKNDDSISTVAALCSGFSWIDPAQIVDDVESLVSKGKANVFIQAQLAMRYASQGRMDRVSYSTGYAVGDEILESVRARLKRYVPAYAPSELAIFTNVLADLVRYGYQAETQQKRFFPYLYDPTITLEETFQNQLFVRLTAGERATNYHYEESDVVGASRIDIVYREQNLVFPIEVKKIVKHPTWEMISQNYVAQVQMYSRPYNQLGFLVIFDISPKQKGGPLNDIRSMVEVLHLTPYYSVKNSHMDYVVAIIIPANKISPSDYTTYG